MANKCIVSVAFREPYVTHSKRQEKRINEYIDESTHYIAHRDVLPIKNGFHLDPSTLISVFQKSLYGFKPHAIHKTILMGYKKVIWFDPSTLPTSSIDILFDSLDKNPIIVRTGDKALYKMTNKKALDWFGVNKEQIKGINHIGGTIYGFNFNDPKALEVFKLWKQAEEEGIFGNQDEFMAGHWADESCLALAMYKCRMPQYWESKFTYLNQKEL